MSINDQLWAKVDKTETCWLWTGSTRHGGYGAIRSGTTPRRWRPVHRVAYEQLVGPVPEGLVLDHLCRQRLCVRPDHLEPVTLRVNILRGTGWGARNAAKTHCPSGHLYDTITYNGWRRCSICWKASVRRYQARRRAAMREARAARAHQAGTDPRPLTRTPRRGRLRFMPTPTTKTYELVAAEIRAEMARQRMTQATLAERLGIDRSTISRKLAGEHPFDLLDLERIADVLGVPLSRFLGVAA